MTLKLYIHDISLYIIVFLLSLLINFCCFANIQFPKTYNGKSGNRHFSLSQREYIEFLFKEVFLEKFTMFHMFFSKSLNLIGCHDNTRIKSIFSKNLPFNSLEGDGAGT